MRHATDEADSRGTGGHRLPGAPLPVPEWLVRRLPRATLKRLAPARRVPILVIGMSHTVAVSNALDEAPDPRIGVLNLRDAGEERPAVTPQLMARYRPGVVVSMIGGAHYHKLGLLESEEPFDFEWPAVPGILPERRRIPQREVMAVLSGHMRNALARVAAVQDFYAAPMAMVSAPPPIGDDADLSKQLGVFRRRAGKAETITPGSIRLKLFGVQTALARTFCADRGITFIEPPAQACDADGFLAPPYRRGDAVHGNQRYGALVLTQIDAFARSAATRPSPEVAADCGSPVEARS